MAKWFRSPKLGIVKVGVIHRLSVWSPLMVVYVWYQHTLILSIFACFQLIFNVLARALNHIFNVLAPHFLVENHVGKVSVSTNFQLHFPLTSTWFSTWIHFLWPHFPCAIMWYHMVLFTCEKLECSYRTYLAYLSSAVLLHLNLISKGLILI